MSAAPSSAPPMTSPLARRVLWVLLAWMGLGLAARLVVWALQGGYHYPDEIFQQLEPGYWLQTGVGWLPWEFGRGLRTWLVPAEYGGFLEVLSWFGLRGLDAQRVIVLHHALWSLTLIPAGYRIGRILGAESSFKTQPAASGPPDVRPTLAGGPFGLDRATLTGLAIAFFMALLPTLLYWTPHTLQGTPGLLCFTWGLVHWLEGTRAETAQAARRAAFWVGFWFGLTGVFRFTAGFYMVVPIIAMLVRPSAHLSRLATLGRILLGAAGPVLALGVVDWATWGKPFHSIIEHIKYNYIEGGASDHGKSPTLFYLAVAMWARLGPLAPLFVAVALAGLKRTWLLLLTAALPLVLLSTVPHKEERFLMNQWPIFAAMLGVGLVTLVTFVRSKTAHLASGRVAAEGLGLVLGLSLLATNALGTAPTDVPFIDGQQPHDLQWRERADIFAAQDFVGRQPDASGLLLHDRQHLNGGYVVMGRTIPQVPFNRRLLAASVFDYAALPTDGPEAKVVLRAGWHAVQTFETITVYRR